MKDKLFRTKPLNKLMEEVQDESHGLKRALNSTNLVTLGIGAIIGAGIFVLTGQAAAQYAGPAIVISFIISGIACAFAGLCYAEFASMIPISGSAYTYAYATLGELMAWIIGWDLILEYLFASSTVAVGWSGYVVSFLRDFGIHIPVQLTSAFGTILVDVPNIGWRPITDQLTKQLMSSGISIGSLPHISAIINLPAIFIVAVISMLLIIGIKESAGFNNVMVILKVTVIILFITIGFFYIKKSNLTPFVPKRIYDADGVGHYGLWGILRAAEIGRAHV
jgi:APA family basic amino acid/polyamine antiporter